MNVFVNNEPIEVAAPGTLEAVLDAAGLKGRPGIAVAVNKQVVPRSTWNAHPLQEGDRIIIITATQGG